MFKRLMIGVMLLGCGLASAEEASTSIEEIERKLQQARQAEQEAATRRAAEQKRAKEEAARKAIADAERERQDAQKRSDPSQIRLDSGITLADWLLLAELRAQKGESDAVLMEAVNHRKLYPDVLALAPLIDQALRAKLDKVQVQTRESADRALPELGSLADAFPGNPEVRALHGKALHLVGRFEDARTSYSAALSALPPDAPKRTELLE